MSKTSKRRFAAAVTFLAALAAAFAYYVTRPLMLPQVPYEFTLKHGSSLKSVAHQLAESGVLQEPYSFIFLVRTLGKASAIKAGNYQLNQDISILGLFRKLTQGDVTQSEITFIEGWTFKQMRQALDAHSGIRHDTEGMTDSEIMAQIGAPEGNPEGLFFPDTYFFSSGMSDLSILKRAYQIMQRRLAEEWATRAPDSPYENPYQALIMASIIEKETGKPSERPLIAGVFLNRFRLGMRLQTDPTVIYGLGDHYDGGLHKKDLITDTPYNTYTRAGLPPTPIAMPSLESIHAALHPAQTKALYFVAKGDGSHQFSDTLAEHNRAVARYIRLGNNKRAN